MNKKLWKSRIENCTVFQETMPMPDRHLGLACSETGHGRAPYCGCHEGTRDYAPSLGLRLLQSLLSKMSSHRGHQRSMLLHWQRQTVPGLQVKIGRAHV